MNYIWEVLLAVRKEDRDDLKYKFENNGSPYMELGFPIINQKDFEKGEEININPFYRFESIFTYFVQIDMSKEVRMELFHSIIKYLAHLDMISGITKESCFRRFILKETSLGSCEILDGQEKKIIADGIIRLYSTGDCIRAFTSVVKSIFSSAYLYEHKEKNPDLYLYLGTVDSTINKEKINILIHWFLPFDMEISVHYKYHFCIMGQDETEILGNFALC